MKRVKLQQKGGSIMATEWLSLADLLKLGKKTGGKKHRP